MTVPFLSVKPRAIKLKVSPRFPAQLIGGAGIDVTKANGNYTIDLDYTDFPVVGTVPPGTTYALIFNPASGQYVQVPTTSLGGSSIPEPPANNLLYGRKNNAGVGAWSRGVDSAGDTMTGNLVVSGADPAVFIHAQPGTHTAQLGGVKGGVMRWGMQMPSADAEAGGGANTGSSFNLFAYTDDGLSATAVLTGTRNDGRLTVAGDPTAALGIATKQYFDNRAVRFDAVQTLTAGQKDQASSNIGTVRAIRIQKFTTSGTYTPDPNLLYAIIECQGGGGAGGAVVGTSGVYTSGSGGGGGAFARKAVAAATIGASQVVTVGSGGAAPPAGPSGGGTGGSSSVGTLCSAVGGGGGPYAQSSVLVAGGGAGGATGTGDLVVSGEGGGCGYAGPPSTAVIGFGWGGSSFFGGGAPTTVAADGIAGAPNTGAAGSGGMDIGSPINRAGGAGGSGFVMITEFCAR